MTRKELQQAIDEICAVMKGPLNNLERGLLHEDRKDLRARLAALGDADEEPSRS